MINTNTEIWKPITDYQGIYEVSNLGIIRGLDRILPDGKKWKGRLIKTRISKDGYIRVKLCKNSIVKTIYLHRIVMDSFKGYSNLDVNHKDGCKTNNTLSNLEYVSRSENLKHAYKLGLKYVSEAMKDKIRNNFSKTHVKGYKKNKAALLNTTNAKCQ